MEKSELFAGVRERVKGWSTRKKIIYGCIMGLMLWSLIGTITEKPPTPEQIAAHQAQMEKWEKESAAKDRQKKIKKLFNSTLNFGYNYALNNQIKEALHDPDSFEHTKTVYWDKGDYLLVQVTFRAKNRFGGFVRHKVEATMDLDGVILAKALVK